MRAGDRNTDKDQQQNLTSVFPADTQSHRGPSSPDARVSLPEPYFIKFFLDECVSSMKLYAAMTLTSLKRRAAAEVATVDFTLLKPQLGYKSS